LYGQLSEGIHNLAEEECLEKSRNIDKLLKFVIQQLRNESDLSEVKNALKNLRS
jgi:hypothetical protein